jgi:hypothetical protein
MESRRSLLAQLLAAGAFAAGFPQAVRGASQPDRAVAPEFIGINGWLNTTAPLALASLRGKVVLVNFWTLAAYVARGEARPAYKRAFDAQLAVYTGKPPTG